MKYNNKKISVIIVIALCIVMLSGFTACRNETSRVEAILENMTTDEKIGQVLLMNFRKWQPDRETEILDDELAYVPDTEEVYEEILTVLKDYHLGNILLFGESTKTKEVTINQTVKYQEAAKENGDIPLIIAMNHEGGSVVRMLQSTRMPGNMALAATGDVENAKKAGDILGMEAAACGFNLDLAPVVDVNNNQYNPVIGLRSFGADPVLVSDFASAYAKGLAEQNVIATAKHFPGHGDTDTDTHTGQAMVDKSYEDWYKCEAVPFVRLIEEDIPVIMSAHIQYPQLDGTQVISKTTGEGIYLPATLSKEILTGILREKLGFDGVICTDALDMDAIVHHFGREEAVIMALNAGADLLCNPVSVRCKGDVYKLEELYEEIKTAIEDGRLREERLNEAVLRILKLKEAYGILDYEPQNAGEMMEKANSLVAGEENRKTERDISEKAVVQFGVANLTEIKGGDRVIFFVPYEEKSPSVEFTVNRLKKEGAIPDIKFEIEDYNELKKLTPGLLSKIKEANRVIVITEASAASLKDEDHWLSRMPRLILEEAENASVISSGLPYDINNFEAFPVYVVFGNIGMLPDDAKTGVITGKYGPNIPAGIGAALGAFKANGTLPVEVKK